MLPVSAATHYLSQDIDEERFFALVYSMDIDEGEFEDQLQTYTQHTLQMPSKKKKKRKKRKRRK